ncbi:MAG TPA: rod shape-determining protein MreC [Intrasporangium sp.]|uniref:rod shape-determining protein MreC n=1 Tax=Intrasporangium sp. TaxID=1925024 RepID=UPI002D78CBC2|nr:rod shape-determining protein MreC [Intrasporangium sp.]HET7397900.1 rod shape-determining protein MreC [Intrasporangium sp.]
MDLHARRRLLAVLVVLTLALLVADLAGSGAAAAVRQAGGVVLGPVQRALSGTADADEVAVLRADNARLRTTVATQERQLGELGELRGLLGSAAASHRLVAARVVATELSALGGRSVTLDVGSRDGIAVDSTVAAAGGLVGRVVAVGPWTSDVSVLGTTGATVGVRVGRAGTLGTVSPPSGADQAPRPRGTLSLTLVQPGAPAVGDVVTTLGSVDERPYAAGLPVGTVVAVDPDRGQVTRSATVRPAVDLDSLDVVAVVLPTPRAAARPAATPAPAAAGR